MKDTVDVYRINDAIYDMAYWEGVILSDDDQNNLTLYVADFLRSRK